MNPFVIDVALLFLVGLLFFSNAVSSCSCTRDKRVLCGRLWPTSPASLSACAGAHSDAPCPVALVAASYSTPTLVSHWFIFSLSLTCCMCPWPGSRTKFYASKKSSMHSSLGSCSFCFCVLEGFVCSTNDPGSRAHYILPFFTCLIASNHPIVHMQMHLSQTFYQHLFSFSTNWCSM